jgi:hypothetical protein
MKNEFRRQRKSSLLHDTDPKAETKANDIFDRQSKQFTNAKFSENNCKADVRCFLLHPIVIIKTTLPNNPNTMKITRNTSFAVQSCTEEASLNVPFSVLELLVAIIHA